MAVSGGDPGPSFKARDRLDRQQSDETGLGDPCIEDGHRIPFAAKGLRPSQGSQLAILFS